jgi:radical SAM superfamily enzyme YgiQ (UPF0313 family)
VKVVLGGIHSSFLPKEAARHADSVVIGEAEDSWQKVLDDFIKKKMKRFYKQKHLPGLSVPGIVDYRLIDSKRYWFSAVQTTRGCPFSCEFCSVAAYNGRKQRHKKIEDVVRQIKHIKKVRQKKREIIFIVDDNLTVDKEYAKKLFKEIAPLNVRWFAQLPANFADDKELLELAYKSGLRVAVIGFESVNQETLDRVKAVNNLKKYSALLKKLRRYNILVLCLFVFGFDEDDKTVFDRTLEFCRKNQIPLAFFQILRPLPGTLLFERLKKEKRITTYDWKQYEGVVFKPKKMSKEELERGQLEIYTEFYSLTNILRNLSQLIRRKFSFSEYLFFFGFYFSFYVEWRWKWLKWRVFKRIRNSYFKILFATSNHSL